MLVVKYAYNSWNFLIKIFHWNIKCAMYQWAKQIWRNSFLYIWRVLSLLLHLRTWEVIYLLQYNFIYSFHCKCYSEMLFYLGSVLENFSLCPASLSYTLRNWVLMGHLSSFLKVISCTAWLFWISIHVIKNIYHAILGENTTKEIYDLGC